MAAIIFERETATYDNEFRLILHLCTGLELWAAPQPPWMAPRPQELKPRAGELRGRKRKDRA